MKALALALLLIATPALADTGGPEDYYPETAKHYVWRIASHLPTDVGACVVHKAKIPRSAKSWRDMTGIVSQAMMDCDPIVIPPPGTVGATY
jgi:hypothetical protein